MKWDYIRWKVAWVLTISLLLIVAIRPKQATAQENEFEINDGVLVKYNGTSEYVRIPEYVTSIGKNAFKECSVVKEVVIPDSVTSIEDRAFISCIGLTKVILPDSVTKLGKEVFNGCIGLTEVTLPSGIKRVPDGLFLGCKSLHNIELPLGITTIGAFAFSNCTSLDDVDMPKTLTTIEEYAFQGCGFTEFSMPQSVTTVGGKILYGTPWLFEKIKTDPLVIVNDIVIDASYCKGKVRIPQNVTAIADQAFAKSSITSISMEDQVTSIGKEAFSQCKKLTAAKLSNQLERLEEKTFYKCVKLNRINFPKNLKSIGDFCFESCKSLSKTITFPNGLTTLGAKCFVNCSKVTEFVFPKTLTEIKTYPFKGTAWDAKQDGEFVIINQILCRIGNYNLQEHAGCMVLPNTIKKISPYVFYKNRMTSIVIPKSVNKIGHHAFSKNIFLEKVTMSASTILEEDVFKDANENLKIFSVNNSKAKKYALSNGIKFETIGFEQTQYSMSLDKPLRLYLNCKANCAWSSGDPNIATVNAKGVITAKTQGTVIITAKLYGRRYHCTVTIE
ncbi:MAG: leucine-rich repeat domain-containing protein [Clostridiales bacterium]|nr:leucine-rich repeat domain-containing protein [Clostridiales bacterium]